MNLLDATANSVNTIFAQLIAKVGVRNVMATAARLGITTPRGSRFFEPACAITLGSVGFTPLEMTDVYATFASGGIHHVPQAFESVRGANGKLIGGIAKGVKSTRALGPNVAAELHVRPPGCRPARHGHRGGSRKPAGGGQDRDCRELPGRVVLRLRARSSRRASGSAIRTARPRSTTSRASGSVAGGTLPPQIWRDFMGPAVENLPVVHFPTPTLTGTQITGDGTYSYGYSQYPTTTG